MLHRLVEIAQRYLFPPLYGRVVLALLTLAGTALMIGFGGDAHFSIEGVIFGITLSFAYENKSSLGIGLLLFAGLVGVTVWLFLRVSSPAMPRSRKIAELEDAYAQRGNQDSVCTLFREVHDVYVAPNELDDLMQRPETSLRARSLKNARTHVVFSPPEGFCLKRPKCPYRILGALFVCIYFVAALIGLFIGVFVLAALKTTDYSLAAKLIVGMLSLFAVAWTSLGAFSTCSSALYLTK